MAAADRSAGNRGPRQKCERAASRVARLKRCVQSKRGKFASLLFPLLSPAVLLWLSDQPANNWAQASPHFLFIFFYFFIFE